VLDKQLIINTNVSETRIALVEREHVAEIFVERKKERGLNGNIYKAKITRVLPGMQSAFLEIGAERSAFLYGGDGISEEFISKSREIMEKDSSDSVELEDIERSVKASRIPIEKVLRDGQHILVQVVKEAIGTKGARLSMFLSLPGRYLVIMPHFNHIGIAKRIEDQDERQRLRSIVESIKPDGVGVILRTAARGIDQDLLERDLKYLVAQWKQISAQAATAGAPTLLYQELDLIRKITRDLYSDEIVKMVVDEPQAHSQLKKFLDATIPGASRKLELYTGDGPIFDVYGIEMDIGRALSQRIELNSGGYVIVDQTEALTSFDINTGRFVGRANLADTIFRTNMEAVSKIVSELRFRNIGGIIVIDFIDMENPADREKVYATLQEKLKQDKARTNVLRISELGLVQMTRKRTSESLERQLLDTCPLCDGRGRVRSTVTEAHDLLREMVRLHVQTSKTLMRIRVREDVRDWILEEEKELYQQIVDRYGLTIKMDPSDLSLSALHDPTYEVSVE
jgi:ribonuclease G